MIFIFKDCDREIHSLDIKDINDAEIDFKQSCIKIPISREFTKLISYESHSDMVDDFLRLARAIDKKIALKGLQ